MKASDQISMVNPKAPKNPCDFFESHESVHDCDILVLVLIFSALEVTKFIRPELVENPSNFGHRETRMSTCHKKCRKGIAPMIYVLPRQA